MSEPFFLEVIGRRILVKPDRFEHKGLIAIPETAQRKGTTGRIVLIGKTTEDDAVHGLKPGDRILYDRFSGGEIGFEAEAGHPERHFRYLSYDEVLFKINDESAVKE